MSRSAHVYCMEKYTGIIRQDEDGYAYTYDHHYLNSVNPIPISHTLPLRKETYQSKTMISFFDGLIPEGWFLDMEADLPQLNPRDRMGLLLALCKDGVGAISIMPMEEADDE